MKSVLLFIKRIAVNRTAHFLVAIHWILFVYAYSDVVTHPIFHLENESLLFKALIYLDLPALIVTGVILPPTYYEGSSLTGYSLVSWIGYAVAIICISFQWALIGYILEKVIRQKPANNFNNQQL